MIEVKVLKDGGYTELPKYETPLSAGMDVRSRIDTVVPAGGRVLVPTGLFIAVPSGYEMQVRPRSGLAIKKGITVLNSPGTVDADYRNEVGVILVNLSDTDFKVERGDRIAQLVFNAFEQAKWVEVEELDKTDRKDGFGHTGIK